MRGSVSRRGSDVTSMSLSSTTPQMLLTSHQNGTLAVWTTPSLTLHTCIHPVRTRAITETLLSSCWWSCHHVAASYSSGRLAIYELESGQNIVKYDEVESPLILQTLNCNKSILAVCYEEVVSNTSTNVLSVKESICQFVFSFTRIPSLQQFEVSNFACDYRIQFLKQVSPLDLYRHKLAQQLYSDALSLANEFSLDINLLYQNQWESSLFTVDSVTSYLSRITDTNYVLDQIILVRSPDIDSSRNCIELGLSLIQVSYISMVYFHVCNFTVYSGVRITNTLGTWLVSVVENYPLLGDCLSSNHMLGRFYPCHEVCPLFASRSVPFWEIPLI